MPKFYFHMRQGDVLVTDPDGSELADLSAALTEAREGVLDLISERIRAGNMIDPWSILVADEFGKIKAEVRFHDVVTGLIRT